MSGDPLYFPMARSRVVVVVVVDHGIIDHSSPVDDFDLGSVMRIGCIVVEDISVVNASVRDKHPVSCRNVDPHIDRYTRTKWSPAVVPAS